MRDDDVIELQSDGFLRQSPLYPNEQPVRLVRLAPFRIDRYPVTNRQFQRVLEAGLYQNASLWSEAGWVPILRGRRTVASVLRITGHARDRHFTNYHRVLSRAPWSARGGARILLGHLVRAFAPRGPVVVGLDDTIERRWGPKIAARGIHPAQQDRQA